MENCALQGKHIGSCPALAHAEKFKIAAEVEDIELVLILAIQQIRTQTGAAADHLPELCFAHNLFEEHQIQHFRHINTGIQHIHGDGNLRQLLRVGELVDCTLGIGHVVVNDLSKTGQMRILLIENCKNFLRVGMVFCKDDRLAQLAAVVNGKAVGHQGVQHLPDSILVEYPLVQGRRCNAFRQFSVFVLKGILINLLVCIGKFIVDDALFDEFQLCFHRQKIYQIPVLDRLRQLIAIGGNAIFQFKNLIGVLVDLVLGRGGQSHQRRVKIVENVPVLVVNRAVRLVADHQIKMTAGKELALLVLYAVNDIVHGLIGGKDAVGGVVVLFLAEIGNGKIGQEIHKAALGLGHQAVAIGQKQNIFHPTVLEQHITQGNDGSCLAGAGGHDQQRLAAVPRKGIAGRFYGALLVIAPGDLAIHHDIFQACPHTLEIKQLFQIPLGVNGGALALRVEVVGNAGLKAIGQKDDRTAVVLLFQQVGIELCLLAAFGHIRTATLGLHHRQRTTIIAVKHIVRIAHLALVGHSGQLHLIEPILPLCPAGIGEHGVDIQLAGFVFGEVKRLGYIGLLLFGTAGSELLFQRGIFRHKRSQINLRHFRRRSRRCLGRHRQQGAVKMPLGVVFSVAIGHKIQKDIEVFQTQLRLFASNFLTGMGGVVAHTTDQIHPPPDVRAHNVAKILGIHETDQRVLIGHDQRLIHGVHPLHSKLHRPAAVQHTGSGVDM